MHSSGDGLARSIVRPRGSHILAYSTAFLIWSICKSYLFSRHMAEPSALSHRKLKDRKTFLRILRQVREEAHLRQSDVARALGSTQAYVSKYELGERRLDLLDLSAVCEAVGIPLLEFVRRFQEARTRA